MQFKSTAVLVLSAAAAVVAQGGPEQTPSVPASILSVLETAIPPSVLPQLANPTSVSALVSEIEAGSTPGWIQSLPPNVKSYLSSAYLGPATASASVTGSASSAVSSLSSALSSESSALSSLSSSASSAAASGSASAASTTATSTSTSTSTAGAPAATGALAMGLAGVAGIVGLAVAL